MKRWGIRLERSVLALILMVFVPVTGFLNAQGFVDITGNIGRSSVITCIEAVRGEDRVYAGTHHGLYSTIDAGKTWKEERLSEGSLHITGIAVTSQSIFVSSLEGLFIRRPSRTVWDHVPGKKDLKGAVPSGEGEKVLTWTDTEMYMVDGNGWELMSVSGQPVGIEDVAYIGGVIYTARGGHIVYSTDGGKIWKRYFVASDISGDIAAEEITEDAEEGARPVIRALRPKPSSGVLVSTERGILFFDAITGGAEHLEATGLSSGGVDIAISTGKGIMAAAQNKVFIENFGSGGWRSIFEAVAEGRIEDIKLHVDGSGGEHIIIATSRKIHSAPLESLKMEVISEGSSRGSLFPSVGPDIIDVQRMAIDYAEVSPDKIRAWREAARWKAVLPRMTLAYGENYKDNLEIYKSATKTYIVDGPRDRRNDWKATMVWDLGDIIWNSAQTSIDVRSKLMVQLRDNILEDLTRLYFERKRLVKEVRDLGDKDASAAENRLLRIEELTAYIDAYTGGGFSRTIQEDLS